MNTSRLNSEQLTPEELALVRALFGIGRREMTLDEIVSQNPGVSRQQLEELEAQALRKLRYLNSQAMRSLQKAG